MESIHKSKRGYIIKRSFILSGLLFFFICCHVNGQNVSFPSLKAKRKKDRELLISLFKCDRRLSSFKGKSFFFTFYEVDSASNLSKTIRFQRNDDFSMNVLIDSTMLLMPAFRVSKKTDKIQIINYGKSQVKFNDYRWGKFCANLSNDVFAINFRTQIATPDVVFGYFKNGNVVIVGRDFKKYTGLLSYINTYYGGYERYLNLLRQDSILNRIILKLSIQQCKDFLNEDYAFYSFMNPCDTAGAIRRFMSRLDSFATITDNQRLAIRDTLFSSSGIKYENLAGLAFQKKVSELLNLVLTTQQAERYKTNEDMYSRVDAIVRHRLDRYFQKLNRTKVDKSDSYFLNYFAPLGASNSMR